MMLFKTYKRGLNGIQFRIKYGRLQAGFRPCAKVTRRKPRVCTPRLDESSFAFRTDRFSGMGKSAITIAVQQYRASNKRFITFQLIDCHTRE